ncbi:MAG TPA: DUF4157 domain-containing protein [Acetobacteraceae bacterium]|nr:DUF4157 domain-containing protein [Acetobacteraceae bacterium]
MQQIVRLQANAERSNAVAPAHVSLARMTAHPVIGNQALLRCLSPVQRGLQRQLEIGAANDPLEHEADAAAEHVMRMPAKVSSGVPAKLTRKCAACEENERQGAPGKCSACAAKDADAGTLRRQPAPAPAPAPGPAAAQAAHVFQAEGVNIILRPSCATTGGFSFAIVEAAVRDALDKIFNSTCIDASHRQAMQANLRKHGFEFRAADSANLQNAGACAEGTGFSIPANIVTLGTAALQATCGPLASTVLHEIVHIIRGFFAEALPRSCEASCYAQPGDPTLCRDTDVSGRRHPPPGPTPAPAPAPAPQAPPKLRRDAAGSGGDALAGGRVPGSVHDVLRQPGETLDADTRGFMESRFGYDFSDVRIHRDARAAASARDVAARAYTVGNHIAFGGNAYRPADVEGRKLLAHELAHVVQQGDTGGAAAPAPIPALRRDFDSTMQICHRVLNSRNFDVTGGTVSVSLRATFGASDDSPDASCPAPGYFFISLEKNGVVRDSEIGTHPVPFGVRAMRTWSGLEDGSYHLMIWTSNGNPNCCVTGDISVHTGASAPTVAVPGLSTEACYDGDQLYVSKGGATAACPALTGTVGDPTPPGQYCVRPQGEAQVSGGLRGRLLQDRSKWFLLEPQFTTTRSRMMLHPGIMSAGCITVMDRGCFDRMAAVLNAGARSSATGYDGYPPGNSAGVENTPRAVSCVGTLSVVGRVGGCNTASGGAPAPAGHDRAPPPKMPERTAPARVARAPLRRAPDRRLRRQGNPPSPGSAGGSDPGDWLKLFPQASRDGATAPHLTLEQFKKPTDPVLHDADKGGSGAQLTADQQAARDRVAAARATVPAVHFNLHSFNEGYGYEYGGRNTAQPSSLTADPSKAGDPKAQRSQAVRQAVFDEVIGSEGGTSAINAYDSARLTWGPGMTMSGPLKGMLGRVFANQTAHNAFLKQGIDWNGSSFLVFNEANNSIETGNDALNLIQGRKDLLSVFVAVAEAPDTGQVVADADMAELDKRIAGMPQEIHDTWDIDVLRVAFHIDYGRSADGYSTRRSDYVATGGDMMKVLMVWGRSAAGKAEANGAWMISSTGFKLAMPQFQKWGHGVAWKAIQAVCPVPVTMTRADARSRAELKDHVLIRTLAETGGEPAGFYIIPQPPQPFPGGGGPPTASDPAYYALYELNGEPPETQLARAQRYSAGELDQLIDAWDKRNLRGSFNIALGLVLKAVRLRKTKKKPKSGPDLDADALLGSADFATVQTNEPARATMISNYLSR